MFVLIRVLLITPELKFSVDIKKALEATGEFAVAAFTSAGPALDHLRQQPQDLAVVDCRLQGVPAPDLILRLRTIQADLALIVGPEQPDIAQMAHELGLQAVTRLPTTARTLAPLIKDVVRRAREDLPDTAQAPAVIEDVDTSLIPSVQEPPAAKDTPPESTSRMVEFVLPDKRAAVERLITQLKEGKEDSPKPPPPSAPPEAAEPAEEDVFQRLAKEEPPMPTLEDSGTVRDLAARVSDSDVNEVMELLSQDEPDEMPEEVEEAAAESEEDALLARLILQGALDRSTPLEGFSLAELMENIKKQLPPHQQGIQPLPSWVMESDRYVREPDFLPESFPLMETAEYAAETTQGPMDDILEQPEAVETERLAPVVRSQPPAPDELPDWSDDTPPVLPEKQAEAAPRPALPETEEPEEETALTPDLLPEIDNELAATDAGPPPVHEDEAQPATAVQERPTPIAEEVLDDPRIAQLAVTLTQVSLELTAEVTLLSRQGQVVAYAGNMPPEDIEELRQAISDDWDSDPEQSRIRFITLPSSGQDYMMYSRRTAGDYTLSTIFTGTMPLRVIRRQSRRLEEALEATPDDIPLPEQEVAEEEVPAAEITPETARQTDTYRGPYTPYTYVWLLRDVEAELSPEVGQAIEAGLGQQLTGEFWQIFRLSVEGDFVYLHANVPGDSPPHQHIRSLMQHSAEIVARHMPEASPDTLWAPGYLVLSPGRELAVEEIQQFIHFSHS